MVGDTIHTIFINNDGEIVHSSRAKGESSWTTPAVISDGKSDTVSASDENLA